MFTALALACLWEKSAHAILDLQVREDLVVYEKPSLQSRQVSQLSRGDKVVISPKSYGSFRKILIIYNGKRRGGYVVSSSIQRSVIVAREDERWIGQRVYFGHYSLGLSFVGSYMQQGARNFTTSSQDTYEISSLKSGSFFFSLFSDIPWNQKVMLKAYLSFRSAKFKGSADLKGATNSYRPAQVNLEQDFFGVGLLAKYYPTQISSFWYGGGIELAEKTSSKIVIDDGIPLSSEDKDKSIFILALGVIGWDVALPGSLWLNPDLRLGIVANSDPQIYFFESFLSLSRSF